MLVMKRLQNGLQLAIHEDQRAVGFSIAVAVFAGSKDDQIPGEHHFFEHVSFRGTLNFPDTLSLTEPIERYSGKINAFTGMSNIVFHCEYPDPIFFLDATKAICDVAFRSLLRSEDFEAERQVVLQECLKDLNDPDRIQDQHMYQILFPGTKLSHLPLGTPETVQSVTLEDMNRILGSEFTLENSTVIVTGVVPPTASQIIEREFGELQLPTGADGRRSEIFDASKLAKNSWSVKEQAFGHARLVICNYMEALSPREWIALKVFSMMAGRGMSSPINQEIRVKRFLTYTPHFHAGTLVKGVTRFEFEADCGKKNLQETEDTFWAAISSTLTSYHRFGFAKDCMTWAITRELGTDAEDRMKEVANGLATSLWIDDAERLRLLQSLSFDEVAEMARKLFNRDKAYTFVFHR